MTCPAQVSRSGGGGRRCPPTPGDKLCSRGGRAGGGRGSCQRGRAAGPRSPLTRRCGARRPAAMEEGMSSMQQKAAELEHMAEVLLTGEQLR